MIPTHRRSGSGGAAPFTGKFPMKPRPWSLFLLVALAGASRAQESGGAVAATPAQTTSDTSAKKLQAIIDRFNAKRDEVYAAYAKAGTDEERGKILAGLPGKAYIPEFRAVAEEAKGTDTAVKAWMWVLRLAKDSDKQEALRVIDVLLSDYMQSAAMAELPGELRYAGYQIGEEPVVEALRAMVAESPHDRVRAGALFSLGSVLLDSKEEAKRSEGRDCFEAIVAEYGELAYGSDSTYGKAAEGYLYELDHLQIGMVAPDFEAVDENGAAWKLSDYRGKVVVVDFWGNW